MIPVTQTKVVINDSKGNPIVRGNCLAAVIASILELPITEVPNFEIWFQWRDNFDEHLRDRFLNQKGYKWDDGYCFRVFHPEILEADGDDVYDKLTISKLQKELKDQFYSCIGKSPRGVYHITIYQNGQMIHDPHPTREGILLIEQFFQIVPLNEDELARVKYLIEPKKINFPYIK